MKLIDKYDNFLIDLDGVMWNGHCAIPGSIAAINLLNSLNKNVFFITNNAALTKEELRERFLHQGFSADHGRLYTPGHGVLKYLKEHYSNTQKVVVIGMIGLRKYLEDAGYRVIYPPDLKILLKSFQDFENFEVESGIDAVIAAYDVEFDYASMLYCSACLQNGADLLALTEDRFFIFGKALVPASGCTVKFLETATGKQAHVIGKPNRIIFDIIAEEHSLEQGKTIMIGDSIESDILMGINSGIDTALVLSGITSREQIMNYSYKPSYVMDCLGSIADFKI